MTKPLIILWDEYPDFCGDTGHLKVGNNAHDNFVVRSLDHMDRFLIHDSPDLASQVIDIFQRNLI